MPTQTCTALPGFKISVSTAADLVPPDADDGKKMLVAPFNYWKPTLLQLVQSLAEVVYTGVRVTSVLQ